MASRTLAASNPNSSIRVDIDLPSSRAACSSSTEMPNALATSSSLLIYYQRSLILDQPGLFFGQITLSNCLFEGSCVGLLARRLELFHGDAQRLSQQSIIIDAFAKAEIAAASRPARAFKTKPSRLGLFRCFILSLGSG